MEMNNKLHEIDELLNKNQIDSALSLPLGKEMAASDRIRRMLGATKKYDKNQDNAVTGLTLGDFLYDYFSINTEALRGIDFASARDISSLGPFSEYAEEVEELSSLPHTGVINRFSGYVAEQTAALHLASGGHIVEFPDGPSQPGWDILVDGKPFQVKCLSDTSGLYEHFDKYPDIPVLTNVELFDKANGMENVYAVPGMYHREIHDITEQTINAGADLMDFGIPWFTFMASSLQNAFAVYSGKTDFECGAINIASDVGGRSIGGFVGKVGGGFAGGLLFGGAGWVVMPLAGALFGAVKGKSISKYVKGKVFLSKESENLKAALSKLAEKAADAIDAVQGIQKDKYSKLAAQKDSGLLANAGKVLDYILNKLNVDIEYRKTKQRQLRDLASNSRNISPLELLRKVLLLVEKKSAHSVYFQDELKEVGKALDTFLIKCRKLYVNPT